MKTLSKAEILAMIQNASLTDFSLTTSQICGFISSFAYGIYEILVAKGIQPLRTTKAVVHKLKQELFGRNFSKTLEFESDFEALNFIYNEVQNLYTLNAYQAIFEPVVKRIMSDESYANDFFFCHSGKERLTAGNEMNISGLRSAVVKKVYDSYRVLISKEDVSTFLYLHLFNNDWCELRKYAFRASLHTWLTTTTTRCVLTRLRNDGIIPKAVSGDKFSLQLRNKTPGYCQLIIDKMVTVRDFHEILSLYYVERMQKSEIAELLSMDPKSVERDLRAAKKYLIVKLLNVPNEFGDAYVARTTESSNINVSNELLSLIGRNRCSDVADQSILREIFGVNADDPTFDATLNAFLDDFYRTTLGWKPDEISIFKARFFDKIPAKEVAAMHPGRHGHNIDNIFSKLRKRFIPAFQCWIDDEIKRKHIIL